jgi:hypothetical protein
MRAGVGNSCPPLPLPTGKVGPRVAEACPVCHASHVRPEPRVVSIHGSDPPLDKVAIDYDGHTILVGFREADGRLYSVEVKAVPWKGRTARAINGTNLRLPWGRIIHKAAEARYLLTVSDANRPKDEAEADVMFPLRREFREPPMEPLTPVERAKIDAARALLPSVDAALAEARTSIRQTHDPREVANIYRAAIGAGVSKPTLAVAKRLGITSSAAAKQVARARRNGLLPPAPSRGVPGLAERKPKRRKT